MITINQIRATLRKDYDHECPYIPMSKDFARQMKLMLKQTFSDCEIITNLKGYCEFSAFIKKNDKYVYFHTSDFRYWDWENDILIRSAQNENDYTGGANHRTNIKDMKEDIYMILNK